MTLDRDRDWHSTMIILLILCQCLTLDTIGMAKHSLKTKPTQAQINRSSDHIPGPTCKRQGQEKANTAYKNRCINNIKASQSHLVLGCRDCFESTGAISRAPSPYRAATALGSMPSLKWANTSKRRRKPADASVAETSHQ